MLKDIIADCRMASRHFNISCLAWARLKIIINGNSLDDLKKVPRDLGTRWTSTLAMLQTLYTYKTGIMAYQVQHANLKLTNFKWDAIHDMILVLNNICHVSTMLESAGLLQGKKITFTFFPLCLQICPALPPWLWWTD